ncbi:MAG TPA: AAA family ATPase [Acidimicrobiales bacterium]|nr:AAA family ATPase [Acidimicrobiales bacterium]
MTSADETAPPGRPEPTVRVRLTGPLRVYVDGRRTDDAPSGRAASLLALLALDAGHLVPFDRIIDDLWPDGAPAKARQNVASLASRLRRIVGRSRIEGGRSGYRLVVSPEVRTDLQDAQDAIAEADAALTSGGFATAIAAARRTLQILDAGELLEDEPYAAWAQGPRRRVAALTRRARACVWTAALALDDPRSAIEAATAAVETDPFDEEAHRALMRAEHRRGDRGAALLAFKRLERNLHDELRVSPDRETTALYEAIVAGRPELPRSPADGAPGVAGPRRSPLVGRRAELALLRTAWADAVAGRGALVFLCGPAGSGKSRLAAEVIAMAGDVGGSVLRARCNEAERSLFLQPILEALRGHLESVPDDEAQELVGSWAGTIGELLPSLRPRLGEPEYARTGPELEHRRSLEAITEVVARVARRRPTLLLVEDLEHAGSSTLEALRFLAGRLRSERLLLAVTVRPEEGREALETLEHAGREIHLAPFSEQEVEQLAAAMGVAPLGAAVFQLTGGDVLFSVEAFRLAMATDRATDRAADALQVARSLADVVVERVRSTGADTEEFLRMAAVAGSSVDLDLLGRLPGTEPGRAARLAQRALEAGLLVAKGERLAFANRVIHEVLYDATPAAIRASRHRQLAALVADRPELAAVHHEAAGDWADACRAWSAAAERAQHGFANRDAERLFTAAVVSAERAGDEAAVAEMALRRGQVREELGDYAGARTDHDRALTLARGIGDERLEALALERLGWTAYYGRDVEAADDLAAQATALAEAAAAAPGARPSALVLVGRVRHWAGDMATAASAYDEALTEGAEPATVASALSCLGALLEHGDRFDEARDVLTRAMAQCQETGSFRALLRTLFFSGLARANLGDLVGALRVLERKRALLDRYEVRFYRARTATTLSWVWRELGDLARAEDLALTAVDQAREVTGGSLQTEQELHALLAAAECRLMDGDAGAAAALVDQAEELLRIWMPFRWRAELRLVEVASRLEPERAELLRELARDRGSAKYEALALARLGRRAEAAAVADRTGSALLLAEVAPAPQARAALQGIGAGLPREMRSRFVMHGRLTEPLRS